MPSWSEVQAAAPELAARVEGRFDAHIHKVMATLRADGSPRVSGSEVYFRDGEVWFGSMLGSMKARDLLRDPRVAIHCSPSDAEMKGGDAKIAGRAFEVRDPARHAQFAPEGEPGEGPPEYHLFRLDVDEVVLTSVDQERQLLVVEWWTGARGLRRAERK